MSTDASQPAAGPIIALRNVEKAFGPVVVLKGVEFDLHAGEVHALMGENGAGKSTMIRIMSGAHHANSGSVEVDGQPARFAGPRDAQASGIAVVHQELLLFPTLTVAENIFLGHAPRNARGLLD